MFGRSGATIAALLLALVATACRGDASVTGSTSDQIADASSPATVANDEASSGADDPGAIKPLPDDGSGDDGVPAFDPEPIEWDEYADGIDIGVLDVPVDYRDPDGDRFELFVARHRALDPDQRIGSLVLNRGGPGFGGTLFAVNAPQIFDEALVERFDIIGWDPRGVGESEPAIDCIDDFDPYFTAVDSTPETEEERELMVGLSAEFAHACVDNNADIIDHVGELGAVWATLFPDTVRAAVFDGASDPDADALESSLQQVRGFESSLETFLDRCAADEECAFHNEGESRAAFIDLLADLDENPLDVDAERPPVNRDVAAVATTQAMYSTSYWPALEESLASAQRGDGAGLLALHDAYYERRSDGSYGNELEAFQVISCADTSERPTVEDADAEVPRFAEVAPLLVPDDSIGSYFCTFFPPALDPRVDITGAGAGPIVVIGTTGDPATPFESSRRMAEALDDGRFVVVVADQHTGYGVNRCVVDVVNDYLIDLEAPDFGTECG